MERVKVMRKKVRTMCFDCHSKCGVILTVEDGKIVQVEGDPNHPVSEGILCMKAFSAKEINEHPDRLKYPLKRVGERGEGKWERITWEEACDAIVAQIHKTTEEYGSQSIIVAQGTGRMSNHWLDRFNNTFDGGGKVWPTHICLLPNLAQTHVTYGRMFHPHEACDYRNAGAIVAWGTNPIRSRQYSGLRMLDAKRNGAKLIVVDPVFRDIAAKADLWIPIRPGTDGVLAMGISNLIMQNSTYGEELLTKWTNSPFLINAEQECMLREIDINPNADPDVDHYVVWDDNTKAPAVWAPEKEAYLTDNVAPKLDDEFSIKMADGSTMVCKTAFRTYREYLTQWTPEKVAEICWIPVEKIYKMYDLLVNNGSGKPTLLTAYLGACMMTTNALQSGRAITLCQLLLNPPLDDKGGIYFNTFWEFMLDDKITAYDTVEPKLRLGYDKHPMYTQVYGKANWPGAVWEALKTGEPWPVKMIISVANDALGCFEHPQKTYEALTSGNLDMYVVMDYWMTPSAELADIVLPAAHWSERVIGDEELYPEPCPAVLSQIAVDPPEEAKDDWYFLREVGKRIKPELWPWESSEDMWLWRLKEFHHIDPNTTWEEAAEKGYYIEYGGDKRITKQHEKGLVKFMTPTAKIELYSEQMPVFGYDSPLPSYNEPFESPISTPELYKEYPFILTTGGRDYPFYHSAWTNIASQRIIEPWPYVEINDEDARERQISDGEWVYVESERGRIKVKARVTKGILKGVCSLPRQNYKDSCKELNLPGYGWDKANPNCLIPSYGADPGFGCAPMRSSLCRILRVEI
jgi:anaerobic selenocysteine-containing dehydrogenase